MRRVQPDLEMIRECTAVPPGKRSDRSIANLMEEIKYLRYFRNVADRAGSKMLREYCKLIEIKSLPSEARFSLDGLLVVILLGKLEVFENNDKVGECLQGSEVITQDASAECQAKGFTVLLFIRSNIYQRFLEMEDRAQKMQLKKMKVLAKNEPVFHIAQQLRKSTLLKSLPDYDIRELAFKSTILSFAKGEKIYHQNAQPKYLYYIIKGQVSISQSQQVQKKASFLQKNKPKNRMSLSICYIHDFFGLEQTFSNQFYRSMAIAMMQTSVVCININAVHEIINPVCSIELFNSVTDLVEAKGRLLLVRRTRRPVIQPQTILKQHNIAEKLYDIMGDPNQARLGIRSKFHNLPYRCYLPSKLFHQSTIVRQFMEPPEIKLNDIGVFDKAQEFYKTQRMTRYRSQFKKEKSPRVISRSVSKGDSLLQTPNKSYQRLLIPKLNTTALQQIQKSIHSTSVSLRQQTKPLRFTDQ